ncbi:MAG: O-antigen ligase family protein [Fimbriimonadales bacterium]|nr:O-antigen ligase family protein [Fimbriimonadales bacterium]
MSLARATISMSRFFDDLAGGGAGRRAVLMSLIVAGGVLVIACGLLLMYGVTGAPLIGSIALMLTLVTVTLMVIRPEWLFVMGIVLGHTLFYGRFPRQLGMRVYDSVGPGDILFFLTFVGTIIYWAGQKDKPTIRWSVILLPMMLFVYTAGYMLIAFFLWKRQDIALSQAVGWMYFTLVIPAYFGLCTGRVWKFFVLTLMASLVAGAFLSFLIETGVRNELISRMGYGGLGARSFGDLTVRTNQLGMAVAGTLFFTVLAAFAQRPFWKYASIVAGLSSAAILFFDRGRATYGAIAIAMLLLILFLPQAPRLRFLIRASTSIIVVVLFILAIGGETQKKFANAFEKSLEAIALTSKQAVDYDPGLVYRMHRLNQAQAIFNENPIFGGGPGTQFGTALNWETMENVPISSIDNSWLFPMSVGGLVGMGLILGCYAAFIIACIGAVIKLRNPLHRCIAFVPLCQMVWLFICSPVNWWMVDRFHIAAMSIFVGMALALVYHERVHGSDVSFIDL